MTSVVLELATVAHVDLVAPRMRAQDAAEVLASGGYTPREALLSALEVSDFARTAFIGAEPLGMFGVRGPRPIDEMVANAAGIYRVPAIPWLLTTALVDRYPLTFYRASKTVLGELVQAYPDLLQNVDARYGGALSWLRRLGFTVSEAVPFGRAQLPFHPVSIGGA